MESLEKEPESLEETIAELQQDKQELEGRRKEVEEKLHEKLVQFNKESAVMQVGNNRVEVFLVEETYLLIVFLGLICFCGPVE